METLVVNSPFCLSLVLSLPVQPSHSHKRRSGISRGIARATMVNCLVQKRKKRIFLTKMRKDIVTLSFFFFFEKEMKCIENN